MAGGLKPSEAVTSYRREAAFTTLNRFVALKMLEARGLVQEAVSRGEQSSGFREFTGLVPGLVRLPDHGYRLYLESLFDEIGREVKVLFDRSDPPSLLWPGHQAFQDLLALLNQPDLAAVWGEDETIGWVYQYFNSDDERRQMRAESQAPRSSRELAVRNQFFTPRYVVEFLTDNTLGRTWYEMRQGDTGLVDRCPYLVRRRRPVFLGLGEIGPEPFQVREDITGLGFSEADMWTRPNQDLEAPHDIYLYAMTLDGDRWAGERFNRESRELFEERERGYRDTGKWDGSFEELRCALFYLLRSCNRFGAPDPEEWPLEEIRSLHQEVCRRWDLETAYIQFRARKDPRDLKILDPACGSGHFLLYCFDILIFIYEEAWTDARSPASEVTGRTLRQDYSDMVALRAAIPGLVMRHNLHGIDIDPRATQIAALAVWMRAQRAFRDFGLTSRPLIRRTNIVLAEPMPGEPEMRSEFLAKLDHPLAGLVENVFESMELAGVAGSLLRIEEDIQDALREARKKWKDLPRASQLALEGLGPSGDHMKFDELWQVTDDTYWDSAERRVYQALERYANPAPNRAPYHRRLFADDMARGFALVDLLRGRYDLILMNPPFGRPIERIRPFLEAKYRHGVTDLSSLFVQRSEQLLSSNGRVGAITNRSGFFIGTHEEWRRWLVMGSCSLELVADLGSGVLDALVETVAYAFSKRPAGADAHRPEAMITCFRGTRSKEKQRLLSSQTSFQDMSETFVLDGRTLHLNPKSMFCYWLPAPLLHHLSSNRTVESRFKVTAGLGTDDNFRFVRAWWEIPIRRERNGDWAWLAKGGAYSTFFYDVHLRLRWERHGEEMAASAEMRNANVARTRCSSQYYGRPAVGFSRRTSLPLSARFLPVGCAFTDKTVACVPVDSTSEQSEIDMLTLVALLNSSSGALLASSWTLASDDAARSYEAGVMAKMPFPEEVSADRRLADCSLRAWKLAVSRYLLDETSIYYGARVLESSANATDLKEQYRGVLLEIDKIVSQRLGFEGEGRPHFDLADYLSNSEEGVQADERLSNASIALGRKFGRWRDAGDLSANEVAENPFAALPEQPPGLRGADSDEWQFPYAVDSDDDIFRCAPLREEESTSRELPAGERAETAQVLDEAHSSAPLDPCALFAYHLKVYSKSRRKAPIYWQLSTSCAGYSVWLYYHRQERDTLFRLLSDFVQPKLQIEETKLREMRQESGTSPSPRQRKDLEDQEMFVEHLRSFREEVELAAPLWHPNLNDGVLINFAPLWRLVPQHRDWQKDCRDCWKDLAAGKYDWAHLSMHLWPERVLPKCADDRSLAIAHALEDTFWVEGADGKWRKRQVSQETIAELVQERSSRTVRDARDRLLSAPEPVSRRGGRRTYSPRAARARHERPEPTVVSETTATPAKRSARASAQPAHLDAVRRFLASSRKGSGKGEILVATALTEATWKVVIEELLANGEVLRTGEKRGTKYHLADPSLGNGQ